MFEIQGHAAKRYNELAALEYAGWREDFIVVAQPQRPVSLVIVASNLLADIT